MNSGQQFEASKAKMPFQASAAIKKSFRVMKNRKGPVAPAKPPAPVKMPAAAKRTTSDGYLAQGNPTAADENIA